MGLTSGEYFATVLFGAMGMMLLVSAEELITIFVALELTSICLYILTAFHKGELRSQEAAMKYFMFGAIVVGVSVVRLELRVRRDRHDQPARRSQGGDCMAAAIVRCWPSRCCSHCRLRIQGGGCAVPSLGAGRV